MYISARSGLALCALLLAGALPACGSSTASSGDAGSDAVTVQPLDLDSGKKTDTGMMMIQPTVDTGAPPPSMDSGTPPPTGDSGMPTTDSATPPGDSGSDVAGPALPQNLGAACTASSACIGGMGPSCLPTADYWAGGYCSSGCAANADCGSSGVCAQSLFTDMNGDPVGVCLLACTASSTCRTGYVCDTSPGAGYCAPSDCRVVPSVCTASQQCNQATGGCTASSLPTGYPATFPAPPQVVNAGGAVLASPVLVPLFFSNDSDANVTLAQMTAFFQGVGQTNYWKGLSEYGVGPVQKVVPIMLGVAAPASVDDSEEGSALEQLLEKYIADGTGGTPKPTANTLYILNFPTGTTVTQGGGSSCADFGGYHADMQISGGTKVPYAVIPRCAGQDGFTDLQTFTSAASHELLEGATDPLPDYQPAWSACDESHLFWDEANDGSEAGDMCENDPEAYYYFSDFNFLVQRYWSNAAAKAGHDPCYPAYPGEVFFNGAPLLTSTGTFDYEGQDATVEAAKITVGSSATVPIQTYSDASTMAWTVSVMDYACSLTNQTSNALLDVTLSGTSCTSVSNSETPCITQQCTVSNGDTVDATIKVLSAGSSSNSQVTNTELFMVLASQGTGMNELAHLWYGVVYN